MLNISNNTSLINDISSNLNILQFSTNNSNNISILQAYQIILVNIHDISSNFDTITTNTSKYISGKQYRYQ